MIYASVTRWRDDGRPAKYHEFASEGEAQDHAKEFNGTVVVVFPEKGWRTDDVRITERGEVIYSPSGPDAWMINDERDRRLDGGFVYSDRSFEFSDAIAEFAVVAQTAIAAGAELGDTFWHGSKEPFRWITTDNQQHEMDAHTFLAFAMTAAMARYRIMHAARRLKDMEPTPEDYEDDGYWQ